MATDDNIGILPLNQVSWIKPIYESSDLVVVFLEKKGKYSLKIVSRMIDRIRFNDKSFPLEK